MKVLFRHRALQDLDAIRTYIAADSPGAAERMHVKLKDACERLADFPHVGRPGRGRTRELTTVWPYVISYLVASDQVTILKILHGARRR